MLGQTVNQTYNQIGGPPLGPITWLGITSLDPIGAHSQYLLQQQSGDAGGNSTTLISVNSNTVDNAGLPALSTVTASGFQQATNSINSAFFAPNQGSLSDSSQSKGTLTQVVSNATMTATNTMSATVTNGAASVIGVAFSPGYQQAYGFMNTGGVLVDVSTTLTLEQKMNAPNTITATNSAIANSLASASTTLDPSVLTLNQDSRVLVNQFDFQSVINPASGLPTTTVTNLSGFQPGAVAPTVPGPGGPGVGLTATLGNVAIAYTGVAPAGGNYNVGTTVAGDGTASINGVTQNTVFGLNNMTGGPGAGINFSADPTAGGGTNAWLIAAGYDTASAGFLQYANANTYVLKPLYDGDPQNTGAGANLTGVVNILGARVNNGSASITGTARTQNTDPTTQSFTNQVNSVNVGGTLYGTLTQAAVNMDQGGLGGGPISNISYTGYVNLAVANTAAGPASLTNVSQNMNQSLNTVASAGGNSFNLTQNVTTPPEGCTLCSNNIQVAAGSTLATISGAQQFISNSVNVAAVGSLSGNSTISQTSTGGVVNGFNQLRVISNGNASISGIQSSIGAVNVVK
jgi:hypothetical protein